MWKKLDFKYVKLIVVLVTFLSVQHSVQMCGFRLAFLWSLKSQLIPSFSDRIIESPVAHQWRLEGTYQSFHRFFSYCSHPSSLWSYNSKLLETSSQLKGKGTEEPFSSKPSQCFLPNACILGMWTELGVLSLTFTCKGCLL